MEWVRGSERVEDQERRLLLDRFYHRVKRQILQYQSGSIGLFPLKTSSKDRCRESHVRENIYCAMAAWGVGTAYRHMGDNQGRTYELQQSAVKCMRGILFCYMRQADKVELFKRNQLSENSLHVLFDVNTGDPIYKADTEYSHLQTDVVSLYIITLAQMISTGLQIIYTSDEVNFIQNLVYYIERAYRTPDYGMWERGSKENIGHKELNATSIGMAKAALETINGFNLYGGQGTSSSVIYVDPDAHNRNSTILHSLLPVASSSKVTDASLLMITGFPCFAVDDDTLRKKTQALVLEKLEGKYGLKRYMRDGYKCVLEDKNRKYYEKRELEYFHGIENEWPIFFAYLAIDARFRHDYECANHYVKLLQDGLLTSSDYGDVMPHYYYVPKIYIDAERRKPHSQVRLHSEGEDLFLWGQSMLILMELLAEDLLDINELDPIGRHLIPSAKARHSFNYRYSYFTVSEADIVVQVALISESRNLQSILATFGIETQTPQQIEPIQIWPPAQLIQAYERLGVNQKLGMMGRPSRPIGALGASKIYRILGRTVVTYPKLLDELDFYMSWDMFLVIDEIKSVLSFVRNNWSMRGRPTLCFLLKENNLRGKHFHEMLDLLASFKSGECAGVKVRLGKLQTLVSTGCTEHLDFVQPDDELSASRTDTEEMEFERQRIMEVEPIEASPSRQSTRFKRLSRSLTVNDDDDKGNPLDDEDGRELVTKSRESLVYDLQSTTSLAKQMLILQELLKREGKDFMTTDGTVLERIDSVYRRAGYDRNWSVVRRGAGLLGKLADSLAPGITTILVSGKVVTIGMYGHEEDVIYEPITPATIQKILYTYCYPHDVREAVLQQEMVLYLASYVATMPEAFTGMLKIRIGWIIQAMRHLLSYGPNLGSLYAQPPSGIKKLLKIVLKSRGKLHGQDLAPKNPLQIRQLDGAVHRVPPGFYDKVWNILCSSPGGIKVSNHHLDQLPTISDMTKQERNFQLKVEELLSDISNPEYRQLVVELLVVLATILERNPEVDFDDCIDLDSFLEEAIKLYLIDNPATEPEQFFNTPPDGKGGTTTYLTRAVVNSLLAEGMDVESCSVS
ncbi:phosphorylase b kinase regulatory subunit beta [Nematostella vectensis]|uniref:phosphorylase b kinase regulatory subunit beta n=1 Tax=Nematostella vectensis TaxID=45351 RepID=UPI0020775AA1|nr:phosphorylase b kinase regulatory subunit beta [Nematostella vectensis]XP_048576463.1 phosphorylase b kinase regulatory subunit beta [Nematostella vectensis]XP_048576464.1 phosphorylase b kinase regulatory subunit beta [Nematostella vectensis]XP_048576465.1 phosphorylase b kinase regulatory subunit beta [Nematostella vectensis]XP_048576466.1 phosphorylase b kinase regulatory subunit beta [Nematostella vectensis]XP_048576467.1 phosphorylase b kinase regulatory subunit beta [Nematostella vect